MSEIAALSQPLAVPSAMATTTVKSNRLVSVLIRVLLGGTTLLIALGMLQLFIGTVDVPFGDQWVMIDLLQRSGKGVAWSRMWMPHNEHRHVLPKIVMVLLAHLTGWNVRAEIALANVLVISRFIIFAFACKRIGSKENRKVWVSFPVVAAFLLTRGQAENLVWGWQITATLGAFFTLLSCLMLAKTRSRCFVLAVFFALCSQYSFGNGVVLWPIGVVALVLQPTLEKWVRVRRLAIWSVTGGISTLLYMAGIAYSPKTTAVSIADYLEYAIHFLGAPMTRFTSDGGTAWRMGLLGVSLFGLGTLGVLKTQQLTRWLAVVLFGLTGPATAVVTAYGRVGFAPLEQSMTSRYMTMSVPMWAASAVLLTVTIIRLVEDRPDFIKISGPTTVSAALVLAMTSFLVFDVTRSWMSWAGDRTTSSEVARRELLKNVEPPALVAKILYADPKAVVAYKNYMQKELLSAFRRERE